MLLNFSNHPSSKWSEKQMQAAIAQFQEVVDMPFPNIPPEIDIDGVKQIVKEQFTMMQKVYYQEISENRFHILLSGEQSFIIMFYLYASSHHVLCYSATSERNTVINKDGTKTVQFDFVQFRKI